MCFAISCFFLAFPKNAQKNNAREVAKISLAFSLAFILQIQLAPSGGLCYNKTGSAGLLRRILA